MSNIRISFDELTTEQAAELIEAYARIKAITTDGAMGNTGLNVTHMPPAPPAPAVTIQPPAPPRVPAPAPPAGELDDTGVPWNGTIHAGTKRKTAKGEWALLKGGNKEAAEAWKKQHTGAKTTPPPAAPDLNAQFGAPPVTNGALPALPAMPPAPPSHPPVDYNTFVALYSSLVTQDKIRSAEVAEIMGKAGVSEAAEFIHDDRKRAHGYALLQAYA